MDKAFARQERMVAYEKKVMFNRSVVDRFFVMLVISKRYSIRRKRGLETCKEPVI